MRVFSFAAVATLTAGLAGRAAAQQSWVQFLGFNSAQINGVTWTSAATPNFLIEPGAMMESRAGSMLARMSTTFSQSVPQVGDADLALRSRLAQHGLLETSVVTTGHYQRAAFGTSAWSNGSFRLQLGSASGARGVQVGIGADGWRTTAGAGVVPASSISAWVRKLGLSFTAEVTTHSLPADRATAATDTTSSEQGFHREFPPGSDTGIVVRGGPPTVITQAAVARTLGEARFRVSGVVMSMGLDAEAGMTMATRSATHRFGSIVVSRWITPAVAITGGVVMRPPEPGAPTGRNSALLGIRLANGPRFIPHVVNAPKVGVMATTVRLEDGYATLEIRAPGAGHIEVSGDFTQWLPVPLVHSGGDRWTLAAKLNPGVHRMIVRADGGAWLPPPGLPQVVDLYEGNVGVLVIGK